METRLRGKYFKTLVGFIVVLKSRAWMGIKNIRLSNGAGEGGWEIVNKKSTVSLCKKI